jgi:multimeric flavodoxin WrbA
MKIVLINGSPRKGNTYHAAKIFLDEMAKSGELSCTEYFLPRDLPEFCIGCGNCFDKGEAKCPHTQYTLPILHSMLEADALLFATPVFVWQTTGAMKNFLDHFAHMFMAHRPKEEVFLKKAFILSTATGGLKKSAIKPVATILKLWGINRVYSQGFILHVMHPGTWDSISTKRREKFEKVIRKHAKEFCRQVNAKKRPSYLFTRLMFYVSRRMLKTDEINRAYDQSYWIEKGWMKSNPF